MSKFIILVLSATLVMSACGRRNKTNQNGTPQPNADLAVKMVSKGPLNDQQIKSASFSTSNTTTDCLTAVDKRLTVGTMLASELRETNGGNKITYRRELVVTENTGKQVTFKEKIYANRQVLAHTLICAVGATTATAVSIEPLECTRDGKPAIYKPDPSVTVIPAKDTCVLKTDANEPAAKPAGDFLTYGQSSGSGIDASRVVVETHGTLMCDGKDMGPGVRREVKVYSDDVPSMDSNSCGAALVHDEWDLIDKDQNTRSSHVNHLLFFKNK